jgi:hypothetical protein
MKTPQEEAELEILSMAGTCNCLTKSPDIKYHQKLCVYRLIVERNSLIEQNKLLIAVARAADTILVDYMAYFVDWERMANDKTYKPDYPDNVLKAQAALQALRETRKVEL